VGENPIVGEDDGETRQLDEQPLATTATHG